MEKFRQARALANTDGVLYCMYFRCTCNIDIIDAYGVFPPHHLERTIIRYSLETWVFSGSSMHVYDSCMKLSSRGSHVMALSVLR